MGLIGREVFVPQSYQWGDEAQVDWFEAGVDFEDGRRKVYLFCMRSMASGAAFHRSYPHATQQAFLEAHELAFAWFHGVFRTSWSDSRFAVLLDRLGLLGDWPRTPSGLLSTEDDVFKAKAAFHSPLQLLRGVRSTLIHLRELRVTVGRDGRNRCSLKPYRSKTRRNYPASAEFIFGPSA